MLKLFFFLAALICLTAQIYAQIDPSSNEDDRTKMEGSASEKDKKKSVEENKSPHTFTATVTFASDYRFRGISQTMRQPAVQGNFDYSHSSGLYLGTFGSNVDGTTNFYNNTSMEWDFYGGIKGKIFPCFTPDLTYDVGLIYYYYPGGEAYNSHNVRYNTLEYYIGLTYKWFGVRFWQSLTDYFGVNNHNPPYNWDKNRAVRPNGSSRYSFDLEGSASFDLLDKWSFRCLNAGKLNFSAVAGYVHVRNYSQDSYTHWRATLTQTFDWFNLFLTYIGTNARHAFFDVPDHAFEPRKRALGAQGVVVGISRTY